MSSFSSLNLYPPPFHTSFLVVHAALNSRGQSTIFIKPVDNSLREVVFKVLEYRAELQHFLQVEWRLCFPLQTCIIDDAIFRLRNPQILERCSPILANRPAQSEHHSATRSSPIFYRFSAIFTLDPVPNKPGEIG